MYGSTIKQGKLYPYLSLPLIPRWLLPFALFAPLWYGYYIDLISLIYGESQEPESFDELRSGVVIQKIGRWVRNNLVMLLDFLDHRKFRVQIEFTCLTGGSGMGFLMAVSMRTPLLHPSIFFRLSSFPIRCNPMYSTALLLRQIKSIAFTFFTYFNPSTQYSRHTLRRVNTWHAQCQLCPFLSIHLPSFFWRMIGIFSLMNQHRVFPNLNCHTPIYWDLQSLHHLSLCPLALVKVSILWIIAHPFRSWYIYAFNQTYSMGHQLLSLHLTIRGLEVVGIQAPRTIDPNNKEA